MSIDERGFFCYNSKGSWAGRMPAQPAARFSHFSERIAERGYMSSGIEAVITGLTRNQFVGNHTRVRIPPAAPQRTGDFHQKIAGPFHSSKISSLSYFLPTTYMGINKPPKVRNKARNKSTFICKIPVNSEVTI